jgi:hypothetical protein
LEITLLLRPTHSKPSNPAIMNKKRILGTIGALAVIASIAMYLIGSNSSNMSELKSSWWIPLPIALVCFIAANAGAKKA